MTSQSPWWRADIHQDRRPFLLARGAITRAVRRWFEDRGFTEEDFARYHPGGSLGRALLTRVSEIMRADAALPTVDESATAAIALKEGSKVEVGDRLTIGRWNVVVIAG